MTYLLIEQKLLGIQRIEGSEILRDDQPYKELHNLKTYPCKQSFRDHLHHFDMDRIKELVSINREILSLYAKMQGSRTVNLLIDSKVITVYGDQEGAEVGYNPTKPGRKSYCLKLCTIEEFGQFIIHLELCPGDEVGITEFESFFAECERNLPAQWKIGEVKMDKGYYSESILDYFENKGLFYTISAKQFGALGSIVDKREEAFWKGTTGSAPRFSELMYKAASWAKKRRHVIAEIYVGDEEIRDASGVMKQASLFEEMRWRAQVVVTNKTSVPADQVYYGYNARALIENVLKELGYGYNAFKQPTGSILANTAHAVLSMFAFNIMTFIKRVFFPGGYKTKTLAVIRRRLINVPARILGAVRKQIHVPQGYRFAEVMKQIQEVITHQFLLKNAFS